ncbi:MAG: pantoate kinase [Halobacteria archaeon]|nr:pantoate kinase [Halobacteria archaeon]
MKAFAPGHITGFFSAVHHDDPLETGSLGAGIVIDDGVHVKVEQASETIVVTEGERVEFPTVERVLGMLDVEARVEVESNVPVGCGFGASGAATLATALAANELFELGHDRNQVVAAAHVAEVKEGTGLGDVVPQSLGGVVTRVEAGAPEIGTFGQIDFEDTTVEYTAFGGLDTAEVLGDEGVMEKVNTAGESALDGLLKEPSLDELLDLSWEFALETGLATERVQDEVGKVRREGGKASMAMLGETAFGVGTEDVLENKTRIAEEGARILD